MRRLLCIQSPSIASIVRAGLLVACVLAIASCRDPKGTQQPIVITPDEVVLFVGGAQQLTAVGAGRSVQWSSSDETVATVVAQTGFVQAVGRGTATISAVSGSAQASVTVTVQAPPALALSEPLLELEALVGGPAPAARTVIASNAGDGQITGIAVGAIQWGEGQPIGWLSVAASGGTAPVTLTFTAATAGLARGTYTAAVPVQANGVDNSPQYVAVMFRVVTPAAIVLSRADVAMQGIPGVSVVETVNITNSGDVPLTGLSHNVTYGAGAAQNWLTAALGSAAAPATLTLTANTTGLTPGSYSATVRVASSVTGVPSRDVAVQLTVVPGPSIVLGSTNVVTNATFGFNAPPLEVSVNNGGGGSLSGLSLGSVAYGAGQPSGWLTPTLSATTAPAVITLNVTSAALAAGTYTATIPVLSPVASNSPVTLSVSLTVGAAPTIVLSRSTVTMSGVPGTTQIETVAITSSSGAPLSGLSRTVTYGAGQPQGWLAAALGSAQSPATLTLTGSTGSLTPGTYTATVGIASTTPGVAPRDVAVQLEVVPGAAIQLSANPVTRSASFGASPGPATVNVANSGGGTLTGLTLGTTVWSGGGTGWVTAALNQGTAPATITLTFSTGSLATGSYSATIPVLSPAASNSPVNLVVNVTIGAAPVMAVSPSSVSFAAWGNQSSLPGAQVANVTNSGGGTLSGLSTSVQYTGGGAINWLTVTLGSTTAPTTVSIRSSTTALSAGTYTATVTVASSIAGVASRTVNVTYTMQTFTTQVYPFLSCSTACHTTPNTSGTAAQVYNQLQPYFGVLSCKLTGTNTAPCTHSGGKLSTTNQALLNAWLGAGAPFR